VSDVDSYFIANNIQIIFISLPLSALDRIL